MDINLHVELERGPEGSSLRPADVLVHGLEGQPVAVDFAVAHTLQSNINLADVQPGQVARHTERRKTTERQALCLANGWTFTPFVMETIGSWGGKGRRLLQQLIDIWAVEHGATKKDAAVECRTRMALALVRGLARQMERGFPLHGVSMEDSCDDLLAF